MIRSYTNPDHSEVWLARYRGQCPQFVCVLGFTDTALIPGISSAGATPEARQWTAIADAEYLVNGAQPHPCHPLPPLQAGVSPVLISRALLQTLDWPCSVFNAGLRHPPSVQVIDLEGQAANCVHTGQALPLTVVQHLFHQGWQWGQWLAQAEQSSNSYLIVSECVVGGTTTALGVLTGLGISARGKVNSSHPECNHLQKQQLVDQGLQAAGLSGLLNPDPLHVIAAVGDPMQPVVAGLALAASARRGVLLAGGTQMLAVYALSCAIAENSSYSWQPEQIVVGTTRWVAEDASGDTVGLAHLIGERFGRQRTPTLLATTLNFSASRYPQLQRYEQGFVKEGVGAGGSAIAACLQMGWDQPQLLNVIETEMDALTQLRSPISS